MAAKKKYNMITDHPGKALLMFVIPMILGNLFQQFYNITDSVIVGRFVGEQALAAVGASYAITNVFIAIAIGGGNGSAVVIAQFLGAGKLGKMKTAVFTTLINFLAISACSMARNRSFSFENSSLAPQTTSISIPFCSIEEKNINSPFICSSSFGAERRTSLLPLL